MLSPLRKIRELIRRAVPVTYDSPGDVIVGANLRERAALLVEAFDADPKTLAGYRVALAAVRPGGSDPIRIDIGHPAVVVIDRNEMTLFFKANEWVAREEIVVTGITILDGRGRAVGGGPTGTAAFRGGPQRLRARDTIRVDNTLSANEDNR